MVDLSALHDDHTPHRPYRPRHKKGNIMTPTQPFKAVVAFVLAFATAMYATLQGRTDLDTMKALDWMIVVLGAVVTAGAVYMTTNPPKS